jgi:hypothetical protein
MKSKPTLFGALLVSTLWGGSAAADDTSVDLISPSTCVLGSGRLTQCTIAPRTLAATAFDTAVPMRTTVKRNLSGNCSTQYPLEVTLTPTGGTAVKYTYISAPEMVIRGLDRQSLTSIQLTDSSPWTRYAAVSDTCRISLQIDWNQVDVDSAEQANAILQNLQGDLNAKKATRDNLGYLVDYSSAFVFMGELSNLFYTTLSTQSMQALRERAIEVGPVIFKTAMGCADGTLTQQERDALAEFYFVLPELGDPDDYTDPETGEIKKLRDYLGEEARPILDKLAARSTPAALAQYKLDYQVAAQHAADAETKLALAKAQLAPWLP